MPWTKLSEEFAKSEIISDFSLEESRAFADLAVLVMMVDERVTNEELEELSELLKELPFEDVEEIERELGGQIASARETVTKILDDEDAIDSYIEEASAPIEGKEHRKHTLELLATLAYSDDVDPAEADVCHRIGEAFGFDESEIEGALMGGALDRIGG